MPDSFRLTRRALVGTVAASALATGTPPAGAFDRPWQPSDGVRLAGTPYPLASLDPALARDALTQRIVRQVFRGLVTYDLELQPVPDIATRFTASDDLRTWTFALDPAATFHDGTPITAEGIAASLARCLSPEQVGAPVEALAAPAFLGDIVGASDVLTGMADALAGVVVASERELRISLTEPSATFPMRLAAPACAIVDVSADMSDASWWRQPNGSGPYRVEAIADGDAVHLRARTDWHRGALAVSDVTFRMDPAIASAENVFQAGDLDLVDGVAASLMPLVTDEASGVDGVQLDTQSQFSIEMVMFNANEPPFDDPHIRAALVAALDVDKLVRSSSAGGLAPATGVLPDGMLGRSWPVERMEPSVDGARARIRQSRYGQATAVPVIRLSGADISALEALRDVAVNHLGLRIEVAQLEWGDLLDGLRQRSLTGLQLFWIADYPDPAAILRMLWHSESPDNYTGYANSAFDDCLARAEHAENDDERAEWYASAQALLIEDHVVIPLVVPPQYTVYRDGMRTIPVTPMGLAGLEYLT